MSDTPPTDHPYFQQRVNALMGAFNETGIKVSGKDNQERLFARIKEEATQSLADSRQADDEPADRKKAYQAIALIIVSDFFPEHYDKAVQMFEAKSKRFMIA